MTQTKRVALAALVSATLLAMTACSSGSNPSASTDSSDSVRIGVVLDQTGSQASASIAFLNGIQLAVDEANEAGGIDGATIELLVEDGTSDPAVAAAAARTLSTKTDVVIGSGSGPGCRAMQPILDAASVLQFCLSPQSFDITPTFFWALAPVTDYIAATAPWLESIDAHRIGFIGVEGATGDGYFSIFNYLAKTYPDKYEIVADQRFPAGTTNLETQMTLVRDAEPDIVVAGTSGGDIVAVAQAVKALGMDQPIWVGTGSATLEALNPLATDLPAGGLFTNAFWIDIADEVPSSLSYAGEVTAFAQAYEAAYDQPAVTLAAGAYDATNLVLESLRAGASTGPEIADAIVGSAFTGVLGDYTFADDKHQGASMEPVIMQYTGADGFTLAFNGE